VSREFGLVLNTDSSYPVCYSERWFKTGFKGRVNSGLIGLKL